jgi:hypothetical protein
MFFLYVCRRAPFSGLRQTFMNEWIDRPVAVVTVYLSMGTLLGNMEWAALLGTLERKTLSNM